MLTFIQKSVKYDRWMIEGLIDQFIHRLDLRRQKHWILSQVTVVSPRDIFHPQKNSILNNRWSIISNEEFKTSVKMSKKNGISIFFTDILYLVAKVHPTRILRIMSATNVVHTKILNKESQCLHRIFFSFLCFVL